MDKVTHISTGGGASLELLEGKKCVLNLGKQLPGLVVIDKKHECDKSKKLQ